MVIFDAIEMIVTWMSVGSLGHKVCGTNLQKLLHQGGTQNDSFSWFLRKLFIFTFEI